MPTLIDWIVPDYVLDQKEKRAKQDKDAKENPVDVRKIDEAQQTIDDFDSLRESVKKIAAICNGILVACEPNEIDKLLPMVKAIKTLKDSVKKARTDYVSYCVISPYLAFTDQLLFLSESDLVALKMPDKEALTLAAKTMAIGMHNNLLLECYQDVRDQYCDVLKKFKNRAGTAEMEELKVLQTMHESISKEKNMGPNRWMP